MGIASHRVALSRLKPSLKGVCIIDSLGGPQRMTMVSLAGVYKFGFTSRKPEVDIVPSHLKFGAYSCRPRPNNYILT